MCLSQSQYYKYDGYFEAKIHELLHNRITDLAQMWTELCYRTLIEFFDFHSTRISVTSINNGRLVVSKYYHCSPYQTLTAWLLCMFSKLKCKQNCSPTFFLTQTCTYSLKSLSDQTWLTRECALWMTYLWHTGTARLHRLDRTYCHTSCRDNHIYIDSRLAL